MAAIPTPGMAVLSDQPSSDDKLNFGPYAKTLVDIILNTKTRPPLTIGIFGSWGSGKTTLMKMVERGIQERKDRIEQESPAEGVLVKQIYTVWFNAWLYSREASLWRALITRVLSKLRNDRDIEKDTEATHSLDTLAHQLHRAAGPSELGDLTLTMADLLDKDRASQAQMRLTLQHGLDLLESVTSARQEAAQAAAADDQGTKPNAKATRRKADRVTADDQSAKLNAMAALRDNVRRTTAAFEQERIQALEEFRDTFEKLIQHVLPRGYLVIFVDDLDRCLPEKAVEVLEAIKLFLDVPGCIFVLGIDQDVVQRGIRLRYGELGYARDQEAVQLHVDSDVIKEGKDGANTYRAFLQELYADTDDVIDGARYLEKIIQIPFVLPPVSPQAMGRYIGSLMPDLPDPRCGLVFVRGLEPNPRQVKRALNIFMLLWTLARNDAFLADRVSAVRLAKLVVLQQRHPDLYDILRESSSAIIEWERYLRITTNLKEYQEWAGPATNEAVAKPEMPENLRAYPEWDALKVLLTMQPLLGEDAQDANFIDMTPQEIGEMIFFARTVEGGAERPPTEAPKSAQPAPPPVDQQAAEATTEARVPPPTPAVPEGPIPLHKLVRLPEEQAGFIAQQTQSQVAGLIELAARRSMNFTELSLLIKAGQDFYKQIMNDALIPFTAAATGEARTLQLLFTGPQSLLLTRLPWEMIHDLETTDPTLDPTLTSFWGGRHILERPLAPGATSSQSLSPSSFDLRDQPLYLNAVIDGSLDYAGLAQSVMKPWDSKQTPVRILETPEKFGESLQENAAQVYLIYGQGIREVGASRITFGKGAPLSARELATWAMRQPLAKQRATKGGARLSELREMLDTSFNEDELRTLCADLDIDYESLPGEGKSSKARELIAYLQRRGRSDELVAYLIRLRPNQPWNKAMQETDDRDQRPPILFYFVLEGDPKQELDWSGWHAALEQLGARGIIVPLIYTQGEWPLRLAEMAIHGFLTGKPIGEALRDARVRLFGLASESLMSVKPSQCNPLGLIYAHFGPPDVHLMSGQSTEIV
jgi:hypothetical protein